MCINLHMNIKMSDLPFSDSLLVKFLVIYMRYLNHQFRLKNVTASQSSWKLSKTCKFVPLSMRYSLCIKKKVNYGVVDFSS